MARVHRAEDLLLERTVAVKTMRPDVDAAQRTRSEVVALASLSHPSLVTLFDARVGPGQPEYLVMEFVDGDTLSARLDDGPLPAAEVAHLAEQLAEALHVVHAAGIVHRDVKPSNVLLAPPDLPGRSFRAKLADFGIAYLADGARHTSPGVLVGTAAYLAPEQVRGSAPAPAADVYALGLVLLEALTGRRAFAPATGVEAVMARLSGPPAIPGTMDPAWARLLSRMTATDPAARPTATEVARAASVAVGARTTTRILPLAPARVRTRRRTPPPPPTLPVAVPAEARGPAPRERTRARTHPRARRRRRGLLLAAAAVALTLPLHAGIWLAIQGAEPPAPAATVGPVTEPSDPPASDPAPADEPPADPADGGVVPVVAPAGPEPGPSGAADRDRGSAKQPPGQGKGHGGSGKGPAGRDD